MGEYRGHLRRLGHLRRVASGEAKGLRLMAVGPEEYVLEILHPEAGESIAVRALRDCGISREALAELTAERELKVPPEKD